MNLTRGKNRITVLLIAFLMLFGIGNRAFAADEPLFVSDRAGILSDSFAAEAKKSSSVIFERTGCQIAVVTVDFMGGEDIESFSNELFLSENIGAGDDRGLLLLFSVGEEHYRAVAGQGMDGIISRQMLQELLDENAEPYFESGDYSTAVEKSYYAVLELLEEHFGVSSDEEEYLAYKRQLEEERLAAERAQRRAFYVFAVAAALSLLFLLRFVIILAFSLKRRAARKRRLF